MTYCTMLGHVLHIALEWVFYVFILPADAVQITPYENT